MTEQYESNEGERFVQGQGIAYITRVQVRREGTACDIIQSTSRVRAAGGSFPDRVGLPPFDGTAGLCTSCVCNPPAA